MYKMTFFNPERNSFELNTTMKITIEDFRTNTDPKMNFKEYEGSGDYWEFRFFAHVFPDAINACNRASVKILLDKAIFSKFSLHKDEVLTWTVSLIDSENNLRFPRSFTKYYFGEKSSTADDNDMTYLERSTILNRAEDFLSDGTLTLHVDLSYTWNTGTNSNNLLVDIRELTPNEISSVAKPYLDDFLSRIPSATCFKNGATKDTPSCPFRIYDFSFQILTLPPSHELRKHFGVAGINPKVWYLNLKSEIDPAKVMEHVWIFDTNPDRFFISLEEGKDGYGPQLLKASAVISRCVNTSMVEQQEKRFKFSNVKSRTFIIVLYYLTSGTLIFFTFSELVDIYEMSHLFGMEELQKKCAEHLVSSFHLPSVVEQLDRAANFYSDEYLSKLLLLRRREYQKGGQISRSGINNRPDYDCYV